VTFSTPLSSVTSGSKSAFRLQLDRRQPLVEESAAARDEAFEISIDRNRQGAALLQLLLSFARDQTLFEGAISPAADDPDVTRTQPVAQLG
jgi:hypothetical protein